MHLLPRVWLPCVLLHAAVRGRQDVGAWPLLTEGERREGGRASWGARLQPYRRVRLRCAVDDLPVALLLFHTSLRCLSSLPPSSPPLQGKLCMTRHYYETWSPPCAQSEPYRARAALSTATPWYPLGVGYPLGAPRPAGHGQIQLPPGRTSPCRARTALNTATPWAHLALQDTDTAQYGYPLGAPRPAGHGQRSVRLPPGRRNVLSPRARS